MNDAYMCQHNAPRPASGQPSRARPWSAMLQPGRPVRRLRAMCRSICGSDGQKPALAAAAPAAAASSTSAGAFVEPPAVVPAELGFSPAVVSAASVERLNVDGFAVFENVIGDVWLDQMRSAFEALSASEGRLGGHEARPNLRPAEFEPPPGVRRLADLVNKGDGVFDGVWSWPTMLTLASHVIRRPFKLSSLNGHEPLCKTAASQAATDGSGSPAYGTQRLHRDWGGGPRNLEPELSVWPGSFYVINSIWCLDDWSNQAGATRMVPGSHRWPGNPEDYMEDPEAGPVAPRPGQPLYPATDPRDKHPDQVIVEAPVGSVIVFNAHVFHAGRSNMTDTSHRRALHCYYTARDQNQQTNQQDRLTASTRARLSPLQRWILDVV